MGPVKKKSRIKPVYIPPQGCGGGPQSAGQPVAKRSRRRLKSGRIEIKDLGTKNISTHDEKRRREFLGKFVPQAAPDPADRNRKKDAQMEKTARLWKSERRPDADQMAKRRPRSGRFNTKEIRISRPVATRQKKDETNKCNPDYPALTILTEKLNIEER